MKKNNTILTYAFVVLFLANSFMSLGQQMMVTLLPKYLNSMDYGSAVIGIVVSIFSITALGLRPVSGALIDGMNKKRLYMTTLLIVALSSFGYGLSKSLAMIIVFRLLHGAALGCCAALALTMATEELPPSQLALGLAVFGMGDVLGANLGPIFGLAIAERLSYLAAFFSAGGLILLAVILVLFIKNTDVAPRRLEMRFGNMIAKQALIPALLLFLISFSRGCINTFMVLYVTEVRMIEGISGYYIANAVVLVLSRLFFGRLADKKGVFSSLLIMFACAMLNFVVLAGAAETWHLWVLGVLNALGLGSAITQVKTSAMMIVPEEKRGAGSTTCFIGIDIGDLTGPTAAGFAVSLLGYQGAFLSFCLPAILCVVILLWWRGKAKDQAFMTGVHVRTEP